MTPNEPSHPSVLETLREVGALHSRQRALQLLLRSVFWFVIAIPLLMAADVLFHFSETLRLSGTIAILLAFLAAAIFAIASAIFVKPPLLRMARLLESKNPDLGSKLVNILQLDADTRLEHAAPMTRALAQRAVEDASKSLNLATLPPLARNPEVPRSALKALVATVVLGVLSWIGGHHVHQEWLRFIDPYGDHPPFSLTYLEILKPTINDKVLYGGSFTVEAKASGHQPNELFLTAMPIDHQSPPITLPMFTRGDGTFLAQLENIQHPLELTVHTGDNGARSHHRRLELILTPQFGPALVRVTPPTYTGQAARQIPYRFTAIQALEGSQIEFRIESNRPLGSGNIQFDSSEQNASQFPLSPLPDGPANSAIAQFTAERSGHMTFFLNDVDGNPSAETPSSSLTVTKDLPPAIAMTAPDQDALIVEGLTIPIIVDATDDYGLRSVRLHIGINDKFQPLEPKTFENQTTRRHRIEHTLDLKKLGALPSDKITLFAEAVDTRPDPQITRTTIRRMEVITETDYNERLREKTDVAMIAGKYEDLLNRFEQQIEDQNHIATELATLRELAAKEPNNKQILDRFSKAFSEQKHLNSSLEQTAQEMEEFGRDNPVYDFEKDLQEKLKEQANSIRESIKQNQQEGEQALEKGPPPPATPSPEMIDGVAKAAEEQLNRLRGDQKKADEEVRQPLEDLAKLHELMKDFNRFQQLTEEQRELADQSKAYQDKPNLNAEDRLSMREMGARQRDLAQKLDQLNKKLRHDAEAANDKFPEAAGSAKKLAEQMDAAAMPDLARKAAQSMLDSKADDAHAQALNLHEKMDRLFDENAQPGQQGIAEGLDRALQLNRKMGAGDSLKQMMRSKNFRPLPGENQNGNGEDGLMANSMMDGNTRLLGSETLMDGPIADAISGRGDKGGSGMPGSANAQIDKPDQSNVEQQSARRTSTPNNSTLLLEYENIADAYFQRLTAKP